MSDKPKRRWFRFHLSTAVVLTICAAAAGCLNVQKRSEDRADLATNALKTWFKQQNDPRNGDTIPNGGTCYGLVKVQGFPLTCHTVCQFEANFDNQMHFYSQISWLHLGVDVFATVVLLITIGFISEFLIRRREARKPCARSPSAAGSGSSC